MGKTAMKKGESGERDKDFVKEESEEQCQVTNLNSQGEILKLRVTLKMVVDRDIK